MRLFLFGADRKTADCSWLVELFAFFGSFEEGA